MSLSLLQIGTEQASLHRQDSGQERQPGPGTLPVHLQELPFLTQIQVKVGQTVEHVQTHTTALPVS